MTATMALILAALPAGSSNLDFASAKLAPWQGRGFSRGKGYGLPVVVTSIDDGKKGRKALLYYSFRVPAGAQVIRFSAAAVRPAGAKPAGLLTVVLEAADREFLPRQVRSGERWVAAPTMLGLADGKLREYQWVVSGHVGRKVRLALTDQDDRPGCHVVCGGFEVITADQLNARAFAEVMQKLRKEHKMPKVRRFDSKHFMAFSTADEDYSEYRLDNCEMIYPLFFRHFRKRGFKVKEPAEKMMVAIFHHQSGMEAYVGQRLSSALTGLYHPASNRLVVYDYGTNASLVAAKKHYEKLAQSARTDVERANRLLSVNRFLRDRRDDANIGTIMHEVAH